MILCVYAVLIRGGFSYIWVREERIMVKPAPTEKLKLFHLVGAGLITSG